MNELLKEVFVNLGYVLGAILLVFLRGKIRKRRRQRRNKSIV